MTTRGLSDVINPLNDERDNPMIDFYNLVAKAYLDKEGEFKFYRSSDSLDEFLDFETKEQYIAWRAEWRKAYADLSLTIRTARQIWRAEGQEHDFIHQSNLFRYRKLARLMLALRRESKRRAEALYQKSKASSPIPQETAIP